LIKIRIEDLKDGQIILRLDKGQVYCPYINVELSNCEAAYKYLKASGVTHVFVKEDTFQETKPSADEVAAEIAEEHDTLIGIAELKSLSAKNKALELHSKGRKVITEIMNNIASGSFVNIEPAKELVKETVDNCCDDADVFVNIIKNCQDKYLYTHSVNVSFLSIAFGVNLGLDDSELEVLGLGGLFHDVGRAIIQPDKYSKNGKLEDEEIQEMRKHPILGYNLLKEKSLPQAVYDIILYHHERSNGEGYPRGMKEDKIPKYAKIVGLCDSYDAITSDRSYAEAKTPVQALRMLYRMGGQMFSEHLIKHFISMIGVYPVGTMVELSTGETAVVFETNKEKSMMPVVLIIKDENGMRSVAERCDLAEIDFITQKPKKSIAGSINPRKLEVCPFDEIVKYVKTRKKAYDSSQQPKDLLN